MRYLCANAHSDAHYLLDLIERYATRMIGTGVPAEAPYEAIPWPELKTYGPRVRDAALHGWMAYGDAFLRGDYRKHAALWSTSGQPRPASLRAASTPGAPVLRVPYAVAASLAVNLEWLIGQVEL
jgi:hypothetical protein